MGCKDRTGTADKVKAAAQALGEQEAGVEHYPEPGSPGRDAAIARARKLAAAQMAVMAPVLEALERLEKPRWKFPEAAAWMREQARLDDEAGRVEVGDRFEWLTPGMFFGKIGTVTKSDGHTGRFLATGDFCRWFGVDVLSAPESFKRLPREPEGVKVGDCFRGLDGDTYLGGIVVEVTEIDGELRLVSWGRNSTWRAVGELLDPERFERVRAVEVAPLAYEPGDTRLATDAELAVPARVLAVQGADCDCRGACGCHYGEDAKRREADCIEERFSGCGRGDPPSGAAWGGMEPEDSGVDDLDGPAGEERAGVPTDAAQALDGLLDDVERLKAAWRSGHKWQTGTHRKVQSIVDALVARAEKLRPSKPAGLL